MQTPCSPLTQVGGLFYFARMLNKIRLHAAGQLRSDFHPNLGIGFDGRCTRFLRVNYADLVARVRTGGTDEEILAWCYQTGRRLDEQDVFIWNQFLSRRGWNDDASAELQRYKQTAGLGDRSDLKTFFEFYAADEGR